MKHTRSYPFFGRFAASAAALLLLCAASCSRDEGIGGEAPRGSLRLHALCADMLPEVLTTRAEAEPKTEEEKMIRQIHLFFFDRSGNPLEPSAESGLRSYMYLENAVLEIPDGAFAATDATVVAVANVDKFKFDANYDPAGGRDYGDEVVLDERYKTLEGLRQWVYEPMVIRDDITKLPKYGMPMVGERAAVDLTGASDKTLTLPMTALMARIDVAVKIDANQYNGDLSCPSLTIDTWGVHNMYDAVPFAMPAESADADVAGKFHKIEMKDTSGKTIRHRNGELTFSFYTYENIRHPNPAYGREGAITYPYPAGVTTDEQKQRWKPRLVQAEEANAEGSYDEVVPATGLTFTGTYVTHQGLTYRASFRIYVGSNVVDNFEVKRNHRYRYDVTIHGLDYVRNSDPNVYTFDGRINVTAENPCYISIVNERKLDAHAACLPMDVWLLDPLTKGARQEVKVRLANGDIRYDDGTTAPWVRLAKIPAATMEAGGWTAGTGARDFFTANLLDELSAGTAAGAEVIEEGGKAATVTSSRDRIYFYVDENLTDADRMLYVDIDYLENGVSVRQRRLEVQQKHLLPVVGLYRKTGWPNAGWYYKNFFIEYYEEYHDHYDPLERHDDPKLYAGLKWGLKNVGLGTHVTSWGRDYYEPTYAENYLQGGIRTQELIQKLGDSYNMSVCTFYAKPPSALHYCYAKNKRTDAAGSTIDTSNKIAPLSALNGSFWYLPGISGMESILTDYYLLFPEFQTNFYWSSAAAKASRTAGEQELITHARATKVIASEINNADRSKRYVESGSGAVANDDASPDGSGKIDRDCEKVRIRAAYGKTGSGSNYNATYGGYGPYNDEVAARAAAASTAPALPSAAYGDWL